MPFQLVHCYFCGASWSYYDTIWEYTPKFTAVPIQGCVCPNCGLIGVIITGVASNTNAELKFKGGLK